MAALASAMVICWKWKTLAASTASAPACTAGGKCSGTPAPPEAISGSVVASRRSEERRVGKECRSGWWAGQERKKGDECGDGTGRDRPATADATQDGV